jgi:hypothetical protein
LGRVSSFCSSVLALNFSIKASGPLMVHQQHVLTTSRYKFTYHGGKGANFRECFTTVAQFMQLDEMRLLREWVNRLVIGFVWVQTTREKPVKITSFALYHSTQGP